MSPSASPAPSSGGSSIIEDAVDFEADDRGAGSGEDYYGSVALVPPVTSDPPNDHRITFFCWDTVLADVMKTSNKHPLHVTVLPSDEWLRIFEGRKLLNAFELSVLKQQWVEKELEKVVFQLILFAKQQNKKDDSHYKQVFGWNYLKEQMRLGRSSMLMTIYWCSYVIFLFHHPKYQGLKMTLEQFRSHYLRDSHWFDQLSEQSSSIEKRRGRRRKADREISFRQTATEPEEWSEEDEERLGQEEEQTEAEEEELIRRNSSTGTTTTSSSIVTTMCGGVSKSVTFKDLFEGLDELEIRRLCQFRNVLRLAFLVIPAYRNEILLLKVAAVLERSGKRYPITTSGQLLPTTRRRMIYRREAESDVWTREQF